MSTAVLINNYNNGTWLRACVDSVLTQTRPADEIIVYDDGSTDDSVSILRSYGDSITLIAGLHDHSRHPRDSAFSAIYAAFEASSSEHLYLLDGDDFFFPEKIRLYEEAWAARPELVLINAPMLRIDAAGLPLIEEREPKKHVSDHLAETYRVQDTDLYYWTSSLAFRREPLKRMLAASRQSDPNLATDSRLAGIAPLYGTIATLNPILTAWRRLPHSLSHRFLTSLSKNLRARHSYFNYVASQLGAARIHLWRNKEFYRGLARGIGLAPFYRLVRKRVI